MKILYLYVIVFSQLMCSQSTFGDKLLDVFKEEVDIYKVAPKVWHSYIQNLMKGAVNKSLTTSCYINIQGYSARLLRLLALFKLYSQDMIQISMEQSNVTKASGTISMKVSLENFICDGERYVHHKFCLCSHTLVINTNERLSLNVTINDLQFFNGAEDCIQGNLSFFDKSFANISHNKQLVLFYCGYHSKMNVYPAVSSIEIIIFVYNIFFYNFNASFSVMDKYLVGNYQRNNSYEPHLVAQYRLSNEISVTKYLVQLRKNCYINFDILQMILKHVIYDGPGVLSDIVIMRDNKLRTSTFQSLVLVMARYVANGSMLYYKCSLINISEYITANDVANLFLLDFEKPLHAVSIKAEYGYHVNVTVTKIICTYNEVQYIKTCDYGGLLAIEQINDEYKESKTLCENHNRSQRVSQSFYSQNSSLILMFYWYKHYSDIKATVEISRTKCSPIQVKFYTLDIALGVYQGEQSNSSVLKDLENMKTVKMQCSFYVTCSFSLPDDTCVIFQFYETNITSKYIYLHDNGALKPTYGMKIEAMNIPVVNRELKFLIIGSFQQKLTLWNEVEQISVQNIMSTDQFYYTSKNAKRQTQVAGKETGNNIFVTDHKEETDYSFMAHIKSPTFNNFKTFFTVKNNFIPNSKSWMHIIVWRTVLNKDSQVNNFSMPYFSKAYELHDKVVKLNKIESLREHVLAMQLETDKVQLLNFTQFVVHISISSTFNKCFKIRMHWGSYIIFDSHNNKHYISLPVNINQAEVSQIYPKVSVYSANVKFTWIHDNYKDFSTISKVQSSCGDVEMDNNYYFCLGNENPAAYKNAKLISFVLFNQYKVSFINTTHVSWVDAAQLCEENGAFLPYFTSRDEMEELLAWLKLSLDIPPIEALYIALSYKTNQDFIKWNSSMDKPVSYHLYPNKRYGLTTVPTYSCVRYGSFFDLIRTIVDSAAYCKTELSLELCTNVMNIKTKATEIVYPYRANESICTLMLLTNLAEPEWIQVGCKVKLLRSVLCFKTSRTQIQEADQINLKSVDKNMCEVNYILHNNTCYIFLKHQEWGNNSFKSTCENKDQFSVQLKNNNMFDFLFEAISPVNLKLVFAQYLVGDNLQVLSYNRILQKHKYKVSNLSPQQVNGFQACSSDTTLKSILGNLFSCRNGFYISQLQICDGVTDCPSDDSDEAYCTYPMLGNGHVVLVKKHFGIGEKSCSSLYFMSTNGKCFKYYAIPNYQNSQIINIHEANDTFTCSNNISISITLVNDLVADCGPDAEDEPYLVALLTNEEFFHCENMNQIPCTYGHSKCYSFTDICTYKLDLFNHLAPCRTDNHLESCRKFQCNAKFKCRDSYCIPWALVCDGKWDCPNGNDELYESVCGKDSSCTNMFKCRNTKHICLHLNNTCDGQTDCPYEDDEKLCELKNTGCPSLCQCLGLALLCNSAQYTLQPVVIYYPYLSVSVSNMASLEMDRAIKLFPKSTFLNLPSNNIVKICHTHLPQHLIFLDVGYNSIQILQKGCISSLSYLKVVLFDNNSIHCIKSQSFYNLSVLNFIGLSNNPLRNFPHDFNLGTGVIKILSLKNTEFQDISIKSFKHLNVYIIDTTDYHICCIVPATSLCTQPSPWYISCSNLLPNRKIRFFFFLISIMVLIQSVFSVVLHMLFKNTRSAFSASVLSINCNDLLMVVYLCLLWIADLKYKQSFVTKEQIWRSGIPCFSAFGILLWFTTLTVGLLILLSFSRLDIVIHPINSRFRSFMFVIKCIFYLAFFSLLFSFVATIITRFTLKTLPLSLCLPFVDPRNSSLSLKIITWFVAFTQTISSFIIAAMHALLVKKIKDSRKIITNLNQKNESDTGLILQLVMITASNILCWFPANTVYITSMFLNRYPTDMVIWTTVGILPINSLINPSVFRIMCIRSIIKQHKKNSAHTDKQKIQ